tara:strand:- start:426 stop:812 length:387 start_codon:yes stop_codon:yes gene_type:complete
MKKINNIITIDWNKIFLNVGILNESSIIDIMNIKIVERENTSNSKRVKKICEKSSNIYINKKNKVINIANPDITGTDLEWIFLESGISINFKLLALLYNIFVINKFNKIEMNKTEIRVSNISTYSSLL